MFNSSKKFKHLCSFFVSAYSCWILSFDVLYHLNLIAEVASSCRAMNSASFDVCCLCFWKCLIPAKNSNTYGVCSCLHTVAESCRLMYCSIWIWLQNCPWSCRAMNSASFDVCCMCFWKCLIVGKNSNTYAVCSCLHTVAESCRLMYCSIWIWLQKLRHRVERWILYLLMFVVCVFENV